MKVYVVESSTGEWSDRSQHPIKAFKTEQSAKSFVEIATLQEGLLYQSFCAKMNRYNETLNEEDYPEHHYRTHYYVREVEYEEI